MSHYRFMHILSIIVLTSAIVSAQDTCSSIIQQALQQAEAQCASTGRNQACYGHNALQASGQPDVNNFQFESVGDITDVTTIQRLELSGFDETTGHWGVVLMRLQANIPNTVPGQNVTILLFGDTTIQNSANSTSEQTSTNADQQQFGPMQAFYFTAGVGRPNCESVPQDGLLVQTPAGVANIRLTINGVDVDMGSTVYFTFQEGNRMSVMPIEGSTRMNSGQHVRTIVAGSRSTIQLNDQGIAEGEPSKPESYSDETYLEYLPISVLEREIEIADPLSDEELLMLEEYGELLNRVQIEDADELFNYIEDTPANERDIIGYLENELDYNDFDDELESYLEEFYDYQGDDSDTNDDNNGDDSNTNDDNDGDDTTDN